MRIFYDIFFIIFSFLYIPYLLIKGKWHKGFFQKFGFLPKSLVDINKPVWIHAVSVGEAMVAVKLAEAIKNKYQNAPIVISTTTRTGNDVVKKHLNEKKGIVEYVFYYPFDLSMIISRIVKRIDPRLYIMVETELWPNLLRELKSREIPIVLVNGRISDDSFLNYKRVRPIISSILGYITCFCMQSDQDAERITRLGADKNRIFVMGNMKFSGQLPELKDVLFDKATLRFSENNMIIVAGSTHSPEEKELIEIFNALKKTYKELKLVLAPRHIERSDEIKRRIKAAGLNCAMFSRIIEGESSVLEASFKRQANMGTESFDVLIVDTIGHLSDLYNIADVVFIGGSIVKKGGQNPIEAAKWGKTVIFGPYMSNFKEISRIFLDAKAAMQVEDVQHLKDVLAALLNNPELNKEISMNARKVISDNTGAVVKIVKEIEKYMRDIRS